MSLTFEAPLITEQSYELIEAAEHSRFQEAINISKRLIGRGALILGLAAASGGVVGVSEVMLESHPPAAAAADLNDYPDDAKVCVVGANQGQTTGTNDGWCPGYSWGDFIRDSHGNITGNNQLSSRGYGFRNCVDWDAFRIKELVQVDLPHNLGNGKDWDDNAPSHSYTVTSTPEEGDIAESDAGNFGHVGVVEAVNKDASGNITSIRVSQYNEAGTGIYSDPTITPVSGVYWRDAAHTKKWDHFIDVNGVGHGINGADLNAPALPHRIATLDPSGNLMVKEGAINATPVLVDGNVVDFQMSPNRIAILESNGNLLVKEGGLGSSLLTIYPNVAPGSFKVTDTDLLVVNPAGVLSDKHGPLNAVPFTVDTTVQDFEVSPNRVAVLEAGGKLVAGAIGSSLITVDTGVGVGKFGITDADLGVINGSNQLNVKRGALNAGWTLVDTTVVDFEMSPNRIAILEASGNISAGTIGSPMFNVISSGVGPNKFDMTDDRFGALYASGQLDIKEGGLTVGYTTVAASGVTAFKLS